MRKKATKSIIMARPVEEEFEDPPNVLKRSQYFALYEEDGEGTEADPEDANAGCDADGLLSALVALLYIEQEHGPIRFKLEKLHPK